MNEILDFLNAGHPFKYCGIFLLAVASIAVLSMYLKKFR
jgi:hypothetical protein